MSLRSMIPRFRLRTLLWGIAILAIVLTAYQQWDWIYPIERGSSESHAAELSQDGQRGRASLIVSSVIDSA